MKPFCFEKSGKSTSIFLVLTATCFSVLFKETNCHKNTEQSCSITSKENGKCSNNELEQFHDMVRIESGKYLVGTDDPVFVNDGESPARPIELDSYYIDRYEVSNSKFASFVKATNYVTEAEKFHSSFVFEGIVANDLRAKITQAVAAAPWWLPVEASWNHPEGPDTSITGRRNQVNLLLSLALVIYLPFQKEWIIQWFMSHGMMLLNIAASMGRGCQQKLNGR